MGGTPLARGLPNVVILTRRLAIRVGIRRVSNTRALTTRPRGSGSSTSPYGTPLRVRGLGLPYVAILTFRLACSRPGAPQQRGPDPSPHPLRASRDRLTVRASGCARSLARPSSRSRSVPGYQLLAGGCGPRRAGERQGKGDGRGRAAPSSAPSRPGGGVRRPEHPPLRPVLPPRTKLSDASSFHTGLRPTQPLFSC